MPWYVVYTNPKAEKRVAEQLSKMGIAVYCPTVTKIKQWSDRKKKVEVPLFTSYIFVNIEEHNRDNIFIVKGVVRYLFWLGKPAVVKDEEIQTIQQWLIAEVEDVAIENIKKGDLFEIKEGPFKNQSGLIQEINKNTIRLIIESIGILLTVKYSSSILK